MTKPFIIQPDSLIYGSSPIGPPAPTQCRPAYNNQVGSSSGSDAATMTADSGSGSKSGKDGGNGSGSRRPSQAQSSSVKPSHTKPTATQLCLTMPQQHPIKNVQQSDVKSQPVPTSRAAQPSKPHQAHARHAKVKPNKDNTTLIS